MSSTAADKTVAGTPNKTKVVKVDGNTIPNASGTVQQTPPPQPVQQPAAATSHLVTDLKSQQADNPDDIDLEKFISESSGEVKTSEEKESEKQRKMKILTKAIDSRNNFERIIFNNAETDEFIGTKIQYSKDTDGKTIYEYMNDPEVQEHLEFVVPEGDPQDGSPVNQQVTFFWKKPTF
jgi:hypothetical protein